MSPTTPFIQTVSRNFVKLGSGEIAARLISFGLVVYIARTLGAEAYGIVGFAYAIVLYFVRVADFGIEALGPRDVAAHPRRMQLLAPSVLAARLLIAACLVVVLAVVGLLFMPEPEGTVLALSSLLLFTAAASTRWIHVGLERTGRPAVARTVGEITYAVVAIATVQGASDLARVPLAQFIGDAVCILILFLGLRRYGYTLGVPVRWSLVRPIFQRSWPLALTSLLGIVIYNSDLIFLKFFRSSSEVGLYLAAFTIIALLGNLGGAFNASLLPTFTRAGRAGEAQRELYHTIVAYVFAVSFPIAVGGYLLAEGLIGFWFGPEYAASVIALQILIWSVPFLLLRGVLQAVLISSGRQDLILRIAGAAALLSVVLNVLIIPRYGLLGAAATTVGTEIVRMLLVQAFVQAEGFPLTGLNRFWRPLVSGGVMALALVVIGPSNVWLALGLGMVAYTAALLVSGGIRLSRGWNLEINI